MQVMTRCLLTMLVIFSAAAAYAAEDQTGSLRLSDYLESLNDQGLQLVFSTDLVTDDLVINEVPQLTDPKSDLSQFLRPFGLTIRDGPAGRLLVVRLDANTAKETSAGLQADDDEAALPEIVITSSLHRLDYAQPGDHAYLDRELATRIPAAAEEAVRLPNRLPGVASGGISSRSHVRGGEANETLFLLDGLRLYEPFHLKDFQSVATVVNSNAIAGMEFYSGAFPARFGDRMSGVMEMSLREPEKDVETELSLSFFNLSAMSLGEFGAQKQGDWLIAARRGNLDLIVDVIKPDFGSPDYRDFLGHFSWEFGERADISVNFLVSVDKIRLFDVDRGEQASARYDNNVFWLRWDATWTNTLRSETVISFTDITNTRVGTVDLPNIVVGSLNDQRAFQAAAFKQDWTLVPSPRWMLSFGVDAKDLDGRYIFDSSKALASPFDQLFDNQLVETRSFDVNPDGAQYAAYAELRWQLSERLAIDAGLRWDSQSYTTADNDQQSSPRLSLLYTASDNTELRLGWGQFSQAQEINELQLSDGSDSFFPAQRAEHVVANLKHTLAANIDLDLSVYRKSFRAVRPRYENAFNQLSVVPEIQFDRVMIDPDSAESVGAEIMISRGLGGDNLLWWIGYAWAEVEDSTAQGKRKRSWDQTHTVKAGASWRWGAWDFSAAGEVHTGWPRTVLVAETQLNAAGEEELLLSTTQLADSRHSVFHSLDARVSRDFEISRGDLKLFLEVTNIYDRKNPCCTEYSLSTSNVGVPALTSRTKHWLPIVPSLGVVWTF